MAKNSLALGGTPGAQSPYSALAQRLAIQFHFDPVIQGQLAEILRPSEAWGAEMKQALGEFLPELSAIVISTIEACATRFLRNKVRRVSKKTRRHISTNWSPTLRNIGQR
jgi:hypothetical protein